MTNTNYELRIISKDQSSEGKVLKKYIIDGQETIGVVENEPFEIEFKNKTWSKVQIKLSVDGTDISTGALASTSPDGEMFVCDPYGTVRLKAWPESSKGGAEFMFSSLENSVVNNLNGNIQSKGIVAAAVFVEGYSPYAQYGQLGGGVYAGGQWAGTITLGGPQFISHNSLNIKTKSIMPKQQESVLRSMVGSASANSVFSLQECSADSCDLAVGAGDYVDQEIIKVAGLTKPILNTTISVKYESWNSLRSKVRALQKQVVNKVNPAFPGDVPLEVKMIDLKNTPKGRNKPSRKSTRTPDLQRF